MRVRRLRVDVVCLVCDHRSHVGLFDANNAVITKNDKSRKVRKTCMLRLNCAGRGCFQCSVAPVQLLPDDDGVLHNMLSYKESNKNDNIYDADLQELVGLAQFAPVLLLPPL